MSAKFANTLKGALNCACALQKPIVYNAKVAGELAKHVYTKEGMAFPSNAQFTEAQQYAKSFLNPTAFKSLTIRDAAKGAVVAAELYAFFLVGEVIGRRNLIGYKVESCHQASH